MSSDSQNMPKFCRAPSNKSSSTVKQIIFWSSQVETYRTWVEHPEHIFFSGSRSKYILLGSGMVKHGQTYQKLVEHGRNILNCGQDGRDIPIVS